MQTVSAIGTIPAMVRNDLGLYEGDLVYYFQVLFRKARNLYMPYHNARHVMHVTWMCHEALLFHKNAGVPLHKRDGRSLLIAAISHDFDHTGRGGNDDVNIELAVRGLRASIAECDRPFLSEIEQLIRWTRFPYNVPEKDLNILGLILRDADVSQAFSVAWIQQVVFGLAEEWGKAPIEILGMQKGFLQNLKFHTNWAKTQFGQELIEKKIAEAEELLAILK
jgi:hypothetical protein